MRRSILSLTSKTSRHFCTCADKNHNHNQTAATGTPSRPMMSTKTTMAGGAALAGFLGFAITRGSSTSTNQIQ